MCNVRLGCLVLCTELPAISEVMLIDYIPPRALFVFVCVQFPIALLLYILKLTRKTRSSVPLSSLTFTGVEIFFYLTQYLRLGLHLLIPFSSCYVTFESKMTGVFSQSPRECLQIACFV